MLRDLNTSARCVTRLLFLLTLSLVLGGCSLIGLPQTKPAATNERADPSLAIIAQHLEMMSRLSQVTPAEQAEIFQAAQNAAEGAPTTSNTLRYALALATPGHGSENLALASEKLAALLASSEAMLPAERALAWIVLKDVEQRLILLTENRRLQDSSARLARERGVATNRRLQAEIEENARLKRALAEAQAKLDEITRIERSIIDRKPANGNGKP
jgi:hypothetical protein